MDADTMQEIMERLDRAYSRWLSTIYDDEATPENVRRALRNLMEECQIVIHEYGIEE